MSRKKGDLGERKYSIFPDKYQDCRYILSWNYYEVYMYIGGEKWYFKAHRINLVRRGLFYLEL